MENLLFGWKELKLETICAQDSLIAVSAAPIALEATCPDCQQSSARIHSRYRRSLADLPCCGKAVRLLILARRFFCLNQHCSRRLFAEHLPAVMARYARRTRRHHQALETIGLALGGEAGQRTASRLGFEVSADTLLRRARSVPDPDNLTVRLLGVDDFAFRRGSRYGTILVDQERREPIDLLPDREAKTLREWLAAHPEVEVITRDRSPAYAQGARQGAPQATQVGDRFHLMKNLREAVERDLIPRHAALGEAAREISPRYQTEQMLRAEGLIEALPARPAGNKLRTQQLGEERRAQRMARYEGAKNLKQQGLSILKIWTSDLRVRCHTARRAQVQ
jgi:transposase